MEPLQLVCIFVLLLLSQFRAEPHLHRQDLGGWGVPCVEINQADMKENRLQRIKGKI